MVTNNSLSTAEDLADEIVARATSLLPESFTDADVAAITLPDWRNAIVGVLAYYLPTREEVDRMESEANYIAEHGHE